MIDVSDTYVVKPKGIIEYNYVNQNEVTVKGLDIMLKAKIIKNLLFDGSVSFSEKKDDLTGKIFRNVRKFSGKGNIDYNLAVNKYLLNVNLQSNFYGKSIINLMDEKTHQTTDVNLKSFSLWKLTTTHTFKSIYQVKLGIQNIFNFRDETGGYNNGTPGRTYFAGLGISI